MNDYGFLSVIPPLLTIFVALYSKNVLLALSCGILSGALILANFNPFYAILDTMENHVLKEITTGSQVQVILIMFIIGGFVKLLEVSGGASAFASKLTSLVTSRAKAQFLVWLSGLGIFFTDSGNSLIVGPLYRSVFDEFKICREKLAYIIDTTSSPISILIPFIGWGAYITSLIEKSYTEIGLEENAFSVLINVIPYQFYAFLALATVPILIILGKEYGPMKRSQERVVNNYSVNDRSVNDAEIKNTVVKGTAIKETAVKDTEAVNGSTDKVGLFLYPLGVMLLLIASLIIWHATHDGLSSVHIRSTLAIAYLTASLTCMEMMRRHQSKSYSESLSVFIKGAESLVYISIVLVLAWSLSSVTKDLHTANYLASIFVGRIEPMYFPMIVFTLGAIISLSTGSSYGTFAILMSIAIPVGYELGASMYLCIAAVLSGGLFGDHVSPISDTTVLASAGAGCDHLSHVSTQAAYAGVTGVIALLAYGLAGAYESVYVLPIAIVLLFIAMYILMRLFGKRI
ncbi:MAG: Na+/H+ antiporter NhaC [Colwellia sp.]|jgi:Na+/H+ antiporter NhaC|tara:strand:+ start:5096 stop:6643 length:1548 start_codon:yes stop_codon:yes gene_type:complete